MAESTNASTSVRLEIPSEVRLIDLVHAAAEQMAQLAGFAEDDALNVGIAVREAVINAIVHGNKQDPNTMVEILLETNGTGIKACVCDEGPGFDPDANPDPTDQDHLLATSGRGLLMIRAFVDDVNLRFRRGRGMEITLVKHVKS